MAIPRYAVVLGTPVAGKIGHGSGNQPHYHIHLEFNGSDFDIAVNIESNDGSEVLYFVNQSFSPSPAQIQALQALTSAVTFLDRNSALALDYVRDSDPVLVTREEMTLLPIEQTSPNSAMHSQIDTLIQKAIEDRATIYAFGQNFFGGKHSTNEFWNTQPDQGCHDIHMNQGDPEGPHGDSNGTHQDGALFVQFSDGTWSAVFIAFQSQSWHTDNNGDPVSS